MTILSNIFLASFKKINTNNKLFCILCVCTMILCIINAITTFIFQFFAPNLFILLAVFTLNLVYCIKSLIQKTSIKSLLFYFGFNIIFLYPLWIYNGGLFSPIPLYFTFYIITGILYLDNKLIKYFYIVISISLFLCLFTQYYHPEIIINQGLNKYNIISSIFNLSSLISIVITLTVKMNEYNYEIRSSQQKKLLESKEELIETKIILEKANKSKIYFLGNMSHEMRTPLNGISGATDLLKHTKLSIEQKNLISMIESSNKLMIDLINDLLNMSQIETNKIEINNDIVKLRKLITQVINIVSPVATQKKLTLRTEISSEIPETVLIDNTKFRQILLNLLSNSLKYTEKGFVELNISYENGNLITKVIDSGIGLNPEDSDKLFYPYSNSSPLTIRKIKGSGLGLNICKKLTELMGGTISVLSEIKSGSTFTVTLPVKPIIANGDEHINNFISRQKNTNLKILIVEDNIINQKITSKMIENIGYQYDIINNGKDAVNLLKNKCFDIILMDIQMPIMDGITATKQILNNFELRKIEPPIIIACTANVMQNDLEMYYDIGMKDVLLKPFTLDNIYNILSKWSKN
jgi:signal transduction histidine kinase/CheY-like chemotaxis protein